MKNAVRLLITLGLVSQSAFAINLSSLLFRKEKSQRMTPDYSISYMDYPTEQRIHLSGAIYPQNGMKRIKEVLSKLQPGKSVRLYIGALYGGMHSSHVKIGEALQKVCEGYGSDCKVTTEVSEICYSACIDLFMFGHDRVAKPESLFGFHEAWIITPKLKIKGMADKKLIKEGVNPEWLIAHPELKSDQENGYILRADQLQGSNIVTSYRVKGWWDQVEPSNFRAVGLD